MVFLTPVVKQFIKHPAFRKWVFSLSGYNKFGLYQNDLECLGHLPFHEGTQDVFMEALRRLPAPLYDQYVFRVIRSNQLDITKSFVPPEETPTYEEDETKGRFLEPYVKEILEERREKEIWAEFLASK